MYVIAGVTGHTGSVVARTLLAAKQPVRVIVRDAAKGEPWRAQGAEVAVANLDDQAGLTRALNGATGIYALVPPPAWTQTRIAADRATKTASLAGAVQATRPGHVVLLSSIGAELAEGTGLITSAHLAEQAFGTLGVPVTNLRAAFFMENWGSMLQGAIAGGALYYGATEGMKFPQVATEDIGRLAARLLLEGPRGTRVVELAGPAELSLQDMTGILSQVVGKPIKGVSVPVAAMVQAILGQGASQELADGYGELVSALNRGALRFHGTPIRGTVTLEQVLRGLLASPHR